MASKPARARLLWATLSFGPSRHVRTCYCMPHCSLGSLCRKPFRHEEFRPLYHSVVSFFSILSCDPPLLVGLDTESSEIVQETPLPLLFLLSRGNRTPYQFSEHHALRQSRVLRARHKPREQNPPLAQCRLDALAPRVHEGVKVGNRVISATMLILFPVLIPITAYW